MLNLTDTSALVTGGASGLGEATARALAARGAKVVIVDLGRQAAAGEALAQEIGGAFAATDVVNPDEVQAAIDAASAMAPLRVLVNCAGIGSAARTVGRDGTPYPLDNFELVQDINVIGHFNCIRLAGSAMSRTEPLEDGARGSILNTASVAAFDGQIGQVAYSASKGAIVGMTLPIARDLAAIGIRINTIAPGLFDTPIYGSGPESDAFKAKLGESVVFPRRLGFASEFASMAVEVLTNSYMNGETIRLDGAIRMPPK